METAKTINGAITIDGALLDQTGWRLGPDSSDAVAIPAEDAFRLLGIDGGLRHIVVGIIGPRNATSHQSAAAEAIASRLGGLGLTLISVGNQELWKPHQ